MQRRVTPAQRQFVGFPEGSRFQPIKPGGRTGVLVLIDTAPDQKLEYIENQSMAAAGLAGSAAGTAADANGAAPAPAGTGSAAPAQSTPAAAPAASGAAAAEPEAPDDMDYED